MTAASPRADATAASTPGADATSRLPSRLRAALVRRAHGVRGELRCEPLGGDASRFTPGLSLWQDRTGRRLVVQAARGLPGGDVLLRLDEVGSRDAADALRGTYLCVEREAARPLGKDEWFVGQLVGLRALTPAGAELGEVVDVESYPEQDVLVVRDGGKAVRRFPMVAAFVRGVRLDAGTVVIAPLPEDGDG